MLKQENTSFARQIYFSVYNKIVKVFGYYEVSNRDS